MSQKDVGNKIPIYKLKTTKEVMDFYDEWGDKDKYNKDMIDWDYSGPRETVNTLKKYKHLGDFLTKQLSQSPNNIFTDPSISPFFPLITLIV